MEGSTILLLVFSLLFFHKIHTAEVKTISDSLLLTDGDTLVSQTGIFELGFFRPGSSENRYLGIWYKKISFRTVVWVANRDRPLVGASPLVLMVADPGILVLLNNNSMIWSSNTTMTSRNSTAKLRDTGNLVLVDPNEKVIWQSFDYPTNTLLPGMKLGRNLLTGMEWHLTSWKSSQDPALGELTWGADARGYPENKLKQGEVVKFRGGAWMNQRLTGFSQFNRSLTLVYNIVIIKSEVSFTYILENSSILLRVALNSSGQLESSVWVEEDKKWLLSVTLPRDICDTYNICSAYGSCSVNSVTQFCACLDEKRFVPRNEKDWDIGDWSGGCVRRTPLNCSNGSEGFNQYTNVKLPDTLNTWFNMSMTLEECGAKCLKNCTCMAYTWFRESGCLLWFDDLIDIRVFPQGSGGLDIFVRMASSELVAQSPFKKKGGSNIKIIVLVIFPGVLLIGFICTCLWYARKKQNHEGEESLHDSDSQEGAIQLKFSTIATATANFSNDNKLGEGGFGPVYKGVLENGLEIAVKRLSKTSSQGLVEFKNEVICVSKLQHRNLVKLLGYCIQGEEKLLIYEYMPNKSLDTFIFDKTQSMHLDWMKRFNIIKGIAQGLLYLHRDSRLRIIHRDLKAGNILLDLDMNPKISDFGLARSFGGNQTQANTHRIVGTYGYMSPEYAINGLFSIKSDVFSFGVLVLEIVSGNKNRGFIHPKHGNNLMGHAWTVYNEGRSMELIDASLAESCHPPEVLRSIEVGLLCVQQRPEDRPTMSSVVAMLGGEGSLSQPKQPAFFMGLGVDLSTTSTDPTGSINDLTNTTVDAR